MPSPDEVPGGQAALTPLLQDHPAGQGLLTLPSHMEPSGQAMMVMRFKLPREKAPSLTYRVLLGPKGSTATLTGPLKSALVPSDAFVAPQVPSSEPASVDILIKSFTKAVTTETRRTAQ